MVQFQSLFFPLERISVCLELGCSSQPTHSVVCFLLTKNVYRRSTCQLTETRMQRSCKCYLCEEEDGNVPVSILDPHFTQWKLLLSRKMHVSIVFADIFACNKESLGSVGLWRKGLASRDYRVRSASFSIADTMAWASHFGQTFRSMISSKDLV